MTAATNRSVQRALAVLDLVGDRPNLSLSDIATQVGLPTSSALRVLRTLVHTGHVVRDEDGLYSAGPQTIWLGGRVLANDSLRRVCRPAMTDLAARTGESVYLSVRHGEHAIYLDAVEGLAGVHLPSWEGREIPLDSSAAGACLTGSSTTDVVVVSSGVEDGVTAVAAPIDLDGEPVAALSVLLQAPPDADRTADVVEQVREQSRQMSQLLRAEPPNRRPPRSIETARRRSRP